MIDLAALEAEHQQRMTRFKELEILLGDAEKYGDLLQDLNKYFLALGAVIHLMPSADRGKIKSEIYQNLANHVPMSGIGMLNINGVDINVLHHIANLVKPKYAQAA